MLRYLIKFWKLNNTSILGAMYLLQEQAVLLLTLFHMFHTDKKASSTLRLLSHMSSRLPLHLSSHL